MNLKTCLTHVIIFLNNNMCRLLLINIFKLNKNYQIFFIDGKVNNKDLSSV